MEIRKSSAGFGTMSVSGHDAQELRRRRAENNPAAKPTGHYTGRCSQCASADLWHDMTAYGCNGCGTIYFTG